MARSIGMAGDATVFRAVIPVTYADGTTGFKSEGPYGTKGAATARVTFWRNWAVRYGCVNMEGWVEQGTVTWSRT